MRNTAGKVRGRWEQLSLTSLEELDPPSLEMLSETAVLNQHLIRIKPILAYISEMVPSDV
jgi:hypothetical protein